MTLDTQEQVKDLFSRAADRYGVSDSPADSLVALERELEAFGVNPRAFIDYNMDASVSLIRLTLAATVMTMDELVLRVTSVACERAQTAFVAGMMYAEERRDGR